MNPELKIMDRGNGHVEITACIFDMVLESDQR